MNRVTTFQVTSHYFPLTGHFLLTLTLMPLIKKSQRARIITVSSMAYMLGKIHFENINLKNNAYNPAKAYAQSKLANILFTRELAKRLGPKTNVNAYAVHPGIIDSQFYRDVPLERLSKFISRIFYINTEQGAQTTLYCALNDSLDNESGHYYEY